MSDQPQGPTPQPQPHPQPQPQPQPVPDVLAAPPDGAAAPPLMARRDGVGPARSTRAMLGIALLVVGGVAGALLGRAVGNGDTDGTARASFDGRANAGGQGGLRGLQGAPGRQPAQGQDRGGFASGTVSARDGDTVTVQTQDGRTLKVKLGSSTTYTVTKSGSKDDVAVGARILVTGQAADGTITARTIQTGDALRVLGAGPAPSAAP